MNLTVCTRTAHGSHQQITARAAPRGYDARMTGPVNNGRDVMQFRIYGGFLLKGLAAAILVATADVLFWQGEGIGSNLGAFAAVWAMLVAATSPAIRKTGSARAAIALAVGIAGLIFYDPGLILWALFAAALCIATLLPRAAAFGNVGIWLLRLALQGFAAVIGPWRDLWRLRRAGRRLSRGGWRSILPLLPLPLAGSAIFLSLFAAANPLIGDALGQVRVGDPDLVRVIFWGLIFTLCWAALRPRRMRLDDKDFAFEIGSLPGFSQGSITLSLVLFNALFALQNTLDLAFLWSGARLPDGMTLAGYAHRGAYPLIATALLAGLFVLVALRPASPTARMPLVRGLVVAWVIQNVFLVASTILRTLDYIDAYSLTVLRSAALVWMVLVALGLLLILWRMLAGKSANWLINANAATAIAALVGCSVIDLGEISANWNIRHARDVGGRGAALDLCYLRQLGPSALVALVELEKTSKLDAELADRVAWVRGTLLSETTRGQTNGWWTWRNAARLSQVQALTGNGPLTKAGDGQYGRNCGGALLPPRPSPEAPPPDDPGEQDEVTETDNQRLTQGAAR
jgi:Domain of unknown function (DUF4173)